MKVQVISYKIEPTRAWVTVKTETQLRTVELPTLDVLTEDKLKAHIRASFVAAEAMNAKMAILPALMNQDIDLGD